MTVVPKAYIFTVCPFVNVTQREFAPDEWKSAEESAHGADLEPFPKRSLAEAEVKPRGTAAVSSGATGAAEVLGLHGEKYEWTKGPMWGNPILLGHWSGIRRCSNDDEWLRAGQTQADILRGDAQWEFLKQVRTLQPITVFAPLSHCLDTSPGIPHPRRPVCDGVRRRVALWRCALSNSTSPSCLWPRISWQNHRCGRRWGLLIFNDAAIPRSLRKYFRVHGNLGAH